MKPTKAVIASNVILREGGGPMMIAWQSHRLYLFVIFFVFSNIAMAQPLSDFNIEALKKYQKEKPGDSSSKNPFVPGVQTLNDISIQDLILSGTIKGDAQSWALVNGQIISKGEKLAGYDVEDIRDGVVVLKQGSLTFELKLSGL